MNPVAVFVDLVGSGVMELHVNAERYVSISASQGETLRLPFRFYVLGTSTRLNLTGASIWLEVRHQRDGMLTPIAVRATEAGANWATGDVVAVADRFNVTEQIGTHRFDLMYTLAGATRQLCGGIIDVRSRAGYRESSRYIAGTLSREAVAGGSQPVARVLHSGVAGSSVLDGTFTVG
jgi:hypothetical protein